MPPDTRIIDLDGPDPDVEQPKTTYKVKITCSNCEFHGVAEIPKGVPVKDAACPECGCTTVAKSSEVKEKYPEATRQVQVPNIIASLREAIEEEQRQGGDRPPLPPIQYVSAPVQQDTPNRNGDVFPGPAYTSMGTQQAIDHEARQMTAARMATVADLLNRQATAQQSNLARQAAMNPAESSGAQRLQSNADMMAAYAAQSVMNTPR